MELAKTVGQRLKEVRNLKELTQKQMSEKLNINLRHYQKFESGSLELDYRKLTEVCRMLDVSADFLLGLSDI